MLKLKIAIDCMGGDHSPSAQIAGLRKFLQSHQGDDVSCVLYGNKVAIEESPEFCPYTFKNNVVIKHCDDVILQSDNPVNARKSKNSSMYIGIQDVVSGNVDSLVSSGNTGALVILSTLLSGRIKGITKPAIAGLLNTAKDSIVFLDLGASIACSPYDYECFLHMGTVFFKAIHPSKPQPKCGILNVGEEALKGSQAIQQANERIASASKDDYKYIGYVEADKILTGDCDVIITDGLLGNIALKSIEGAGKTVKSIVYNTFQAANTVLKFILYLLIRKYIKSIKRKVDPRRCNGAALLGLNHLIIKSHGSADAYASQCAIESAYKLCRQDVVKKIKTGICKIKGQ